MFPRQLSPIVHFKPSVEAAGIEPAQDSPGKQRCINCPELADKRIDLRSGRGAWLCSPCHEHFANRRPCVYFFRSADRVKIGYSATVSARLRQCQTGSPYPITLWHAIEGWRDLEAELHKRFSASRIHGEWFRLTDDIREFVEGHAA